MVPRKRQFIIGFVLLTIMISTLSLLPGCSKKDDGVIKIGVILPLTGSAAHYGQSIRKGIDFAASAINNDGGVDGMTIQLFYEDSKANPSDGVSAYRKLRSTDGIHALIGDAVSSVTLAFAPIAEKDKVIVMSPLSSAPALTDAGDFIFRNVPSDLMNGMVAAYYCSRDRGWKNLSVLYINNDFGVGLERAFRETAKGLGSTVLVSENYEPNGSDFRTQLAKIKQESPDVLFLVGYGELATAIIQFRELGLECEIISTGLLEDPAVLEATGDASDGLYITQLQYNPQSEDEVVQRFVQGYEEKNGSAPDILAAYGYDAMMVLAEGFRESSLSPEKVRDNLYSISEFPGVTGEITFDVNGDVSQPMGIKQKLEGSFQWVEPTVTIH